MREGNIAVFDGMFSAIATFVVCIAAFGGPLDAQQADTSATSVSNAAMPAAVQARLAKL